jgi:hypothetical protein
MAVGYPLEAMACCVIASIDPQHLPPTLVQQWSLWTTYLSLSIPWPTMDTTAHRILAFLLASLYSSEETPTKRQAMTILCHLFVFVGQAALLDRGILILATLLCIRCRATSPQTLDACLNMTGDVDKILNEVMSRRFLDFTRLTPHIKQLEMLLQHHKQTRHAMSLDIPIVSPTILPTAVPDFSQHPLLTVIDLDAHWSFVRQHLMPAWQCVLKGRLGQYLLALKDDCTTMDANTARIQQQIHCMRRGMYNPDDWMMAAAAYQSFVNGRLYEQNMSFSPDMVAELHNKNNSPL